MPQSLQHPPPASAGESGIMEEMGARSTGLTATALTVCRLVVLGLTLVGIVAMHGLASTDAAGQHRTPLDVTMTSGTHAAAPIAPEPPHDGPRTDSPSAHAFADMPAAPAVGPVLTRGEQHDGHGLMAACVAILLGMLAALALRVLRVGRGTDALPTTTRRGLRGAAARAPPQRLFLSLCVFRN
jgi:hypothetical protein